MLLLFALAATVPPAAAVISVEQAWRDSIRAAESNPRQVVRETEQALELAKRNSDKAGQIKALRLLNLAYLINGDVGGYYRTIDEGEPLARTLDDHDTMCWFLRQKYQREWFSQHYKEANVLFNEAMGMAQQYRLDTCRAMLYGTRGVTSSIAGRSSEAIEWFSKAYALFESSDNRYYMAKTLSDIATVSNAPNAPPENAEKSVEYLRKAIALIDPSYKRSNYEYNLRIARIYLGRKETAKAEASLQTAAVFAKQIESPQLLATVNYHLGEAAQQRHRLAEALSYLDAAQPQASASPDKTLLVRCLLRRAEVLAESGRKSESLSALSSAWEAISKPPTSSNEALYRDSAAKVYETVGMHLHAYSELQRLRDAERRAAQEANARLADELKVRFDVDMKDSENALLRARQKEADFKRLSLTLALLLSVLLFGGTAYYFRRRAIAARTEAAYQRALAEAESKANQAKGQFLANMSHELRSPLNAILGFARLIGRRSGLPPDLNEDLAIILRNGEHLYTLINQVLDMSKIDAGHATVNENDFDLHALLEGIVDMFSLAASQKNLGLSVECLPDVPRYIHADEVKLRQILINLLGNAVKFTHDGSVSLQLSTKKSAEGDRLLFAVTDTGPGVSEEELDRIGKAFVQARAGMQAKEGTGLGLALCRGFAEVMKGSLVISSQPGRGMTVVLDIPLAAVDAKRMASASSAAGRTVVALAPGQPGYRILAVDDRMESRQVLVRLLKPMGFEVREAANGKEAVEIWEQWRPHLIWMDMRMPLLDGREATRRIKAAPGGGGTIIIALSASSFEADRSTILAAGCDDFLRKPFREADLFDLMRKHLGVRFVYAEAATETANVVPDAAALTALPRELRAQLETALAQLHVDDVARAIEEIRLTDFGLADALAALAGDFQYERMLKMLRAVADDGIQGPGE